MRSVAFYLGTVAGFVLPLFNIPLVLTIRKNKSSKDISLVWAAGVWISTLAMLPQVFITDDWSFKIFGIVNFLLFSVVVFFVYRHR